jgi:hypothetical protein
MDKCPTASNYSQRMKGWRESEMWIESMAGGRMAQGSQDGMSVGVASMVATFYLPYVDQAVRFDPEIRIICLKRPLLSFTGIPREDQQLIRGQRPSKPTLLTVWRFPIPSRYTRSS